MSIEQTMDQSMETHPEIPFGIPNLGNTCYLNCAMQVVVHVFGDFFSKGNYSKKIKDGNKNKEFLIVFAHFVASVQNKNNRWSQRHVDRYLKATLVYLSKLDEFKTFIRGEQADSYEFLSQLLDLLSTSLQYPVSVEIDVKIEEEKLDEEDRTKLVFYRYLKDNLKTTSKIDEKLKGYFKTTITCGHDDCNYKSEKFESFLTLSLTIKEKFEENLEKEDITLEDCLEEYIKPITLDEDNMWYCEQCKRKSCATKKMSIWKTAEYFIVSFKRYVFTGNGFSKDNTKIISPFDALDMSRFVEGENEGNCVYDLTSFTVHSGRINGGHYVNARKVDGQWIICNDSSIIPVDVDDINNHSSYYLVYKKV